MHARAARFAQRTTLRTLQGVFPDRERDDRHGPAKSKPKRKAKGKRKGPAAGVAVARPSAPGGGSPSVRPAPSGGNEGLRTGDPGIETEIRLIRSGRPSTDGFRIVKSLLCLMERGPAAWALGLAPGTLERLMREGAYARSGFLDADRHAALSAMVDALPMPRPS